MKLIKKIILLFIITTSVSCNKYLDVVPDNVPTLDYAFRMKSTAERYLATCYSYLPDLGSMYANPGLYGGDEFWLSSDKTSWPAWNIALGLQNTNSPMMDYWNGTSRSPDMWEAISQCNTFLENIEQVPDMQSFEKREWAAEAKFLKAFYHFWLLRAYGPIPIMRENIPISASGEDVRVSRQPVDDVYAYIIELITEAEQDLPLQLLDDNLYYGRVTLPIALGWKAKILTYAASPLFNGNTDLVGFTNAEGNQFFNQTNDNQKWQRAADALKEAIDVAESIGHQLYEFRPISQIREVNDSLRRTLTIRGIVTDQWNDEIIWVNSVSTTKQLQEWIAPKALHESQSAYSVPNGSTAVTMKLMEKFYSENGVPIDEDITWDYTGRYNLRVATKDDRFYIKQGESTAAVNFDREPRFYGSVGFDRGVWFGQGRYTPEDPFWLKLKVGEFGGKTQAGWHSVTGYYAKKLINVTNNNTTNSAYSAIAYPWPMLRLGDLYLLYAEALNEAQGPTAEVYEYINRIRARAGLNDVVSSWANYSRNPGKPTTKEGLREIIRHERTVELAFEGERFWDLRRWKTAADELNEPIKGWDVDQRTTENFYRVRTIFLQTFGMKDYFWPLRENDLIINKNLVQNPGW